MPLASSEIVINRPIGDVFVFLADAENDPKWREGILKIKRISGEGKGARYNQVMVGPGNRKVAADIEITDFRKDKLISFQAITGPIRPKGHYALTPVGSSTRVEFRLEVELRGIKKLLSGMVQKTMTSEVAYIDNLKRVLESM